MQHYEAVILIYPEYSTQVNRIFDIIKDIIVKNKGNVYRREDWEELPLAYIIKKQSRAYYILINFEMEPNAISLVDESLRYDSAILRYLITKLQEKPKEGNSVMFENLKKAKVKNEKALKLEKEKAAKEKAAKEKAAKEKAAKEKAVKEKAVKEKVVKEKVVKEKVAEEKAVKEKVTKKTEVSKEQEKDKTKVKE